MDKNQATGLVLISVLLVAYFWFFAEPPKPTDTENADTTELASDTVRVTQEMTSPDTADNTTPAASVSDSVKNLELTRKFGAFAPVAEGSNQEQTITTDKLRLVFDSKGGTIKEVELLEFKTYDQQPLILADAEAEKKELIVGTAAGAVNLYDLHYKPNNMVSNVASGDTVSISYAATLANGQQVIQTYTLSGSGYEIGYDLSLNGFTNELLGDKLTLIWDKKMRKFEKVLDQSRTKSGINYYETENGKDGLGDGEGTDEERLEQPIEWFTFKQNFFTTGLIADKTMHNASLSTSTEGLDTSFVKKGKATVEIPLADAKDSKASFRYYFGPNNYKILKKTAADFEENVPLGWFPVSLVNKYVIINVFQFLEQYIANYGLIIIILVLIIKLALSPLSYKSYVSMAKTKVLKPELDAIKEKYDGDMQKAQAEQMQLYQKVGVNPLSGCIPMLLQMPILFAMFYFFPSSIELRQESFLWATDLSTYDSILSLPFSIPVYGDHVSLFTILMTASTLLITWSQGQVSSVQGPMKNVQYIMPIVFMFVLNSFPAALSFYYLVANLITFGQQTIIRKMIDENKIKQILEENKKKNKNKKGSKFQQRLQEAMKASEEAKKNKKK
jgi:YidC/Oxa1 family membrane protein insertase